MDKNIVSFIESIEPDFSYQGTEGAMALIVENADNMIAIDRYINNDESVFVEGTFDKAKEYLSKAKKFILESIKKAIAKIKALFMHIVNKAKMLYASAVKKVSEVLAKASTSRTGIKVACEWKKLKTKEFVTFLTEVTATKDKTDILKQMGRSLSAEDIDRKSDEFKVPTVEEMKKDYFTDEKYAEANKEELKKMFDNGVMLSLRTMYKNNMESCAALMKEANSIEKYNDYDAANNYEASKRMVAGMNRIVHHAVSRMTQLFNNASSVVIFAFHQQLKAVLFALKKTITRGESDYKDDKPAAPAAPKQLPAGKGDAKQESVFIK